MQALRRLLFLSRQESALWVAASPDRPHGVSDRAWRMWEDGERPVPEDVAGRMLRLASWRLAAVETAGAAIESGRASLPHGSKVNVSLVWYATLEAWITLPGRKPLLWRPQQSVVAEVFGRFPGTRLVTFDGPAYAAWLAGRPDSEAMRSQWAAQSPQDRRSAPG